MKTKDEAKKTKKMPKNTISILAFFLIFANVIVFYNIFGKTKETFAKEIVEETEVKISNAEQIDLEGVINENVKEGQKEEYIVEEQELEYLTIYKTNTDLPKGVVQIIQEGTKGKQKVTIKRIYENDELISEEQTAIQITKASINKIVEIGGASYSSNYQVKKGDTVYVTSDRLAVRTEPNEEAQKIATLKSGDELKVEEIQGSWYQVKGSSAKGYVKAESTSYINPNSKYEESTTSEKTKAELLSTLSFTMQLNKASGLSLEQFKNVLTDDKDTNKIFQNNAEYFYYIEKQYNINGIFVASIGIHESAWGTSPIALNKNNLFGYGAYDSNPYNGAYDFTSYSESIDLLARVLVKYYLNSKGTSIYGGETAVGSYYNGATLSGVNTKYATDKNWANAVYTYMKYLYNKL